MNAHGQAQAVWPVIVRFNPASAWPERRVEMNADENGMATEVIGRRRALAQGNKHVPVAGHDHPQTLGAKNTCKPACNGQRHRFFVRVGSKAQDAAGIVPTVAGVHYHRVEAAGSCTRSKV